MEIVRHLSILIAVGLSVYGTFVLDRQFHGDIAFIWPVDGVLVSLLLLLPKKRLHLYAATGTITSGVVSAFLFGTPLLLKACLLLVIYLQAVGIVRLMESEKKWMDGSDDGLKGWLQFAMYGLLGVPLAAAAASVALRHVWIEENALKTLHTWYISVVLGLAVIVPLALRWRPYQFKSYLQKGRLTEMLFLTLAIAALALLVMTQARFLWLLALFPPMVVVIFRTGVPGLTLSLAAVTVITVWSLSQEVNPFSTLSVGDPNEKYALAQVYLLISWVLFYLIAGLSADRLRLHELVQHGKDREREAAEKELSESERRFDLLVENAGDNFFLHDDKGRFLDVNQRACQSTGYTHDELLQMNVADLVPSVVLSEKQSVWAKTQPGEGATLLGEYRRKDGTSFPAEVHLTCVVMEGRKVFLAMVRDITDQVAAERAIRQLNEDLELRVVQRNNALLESEARWQFALDGSGDGVWDWDVPSGYVFYSHQWKAMLGFADDEVGNTTDEWSNRIHPEDRARCWKTIEDHFNGSAQIFTIEHRIQSKDGSWRWILDRGKVVERTPDGKPKRVIGTHSDITERKSIERALLQSNERFDLVVRGSRNGIWDWNIVTGETYWSDRFKEMLGYLPHEIEPNYDILREAVHPDDRDRIAQSLMDYREGRAPSYHSEYRLRRRDDTFCWVESNGVAKWDEEGNAIRIVGSLIDITERREAADRIRALNERLQLAISTSGVGIWELDFEQNRFFWDEQMHTLYGLPPGGFDGSRKHWVKLVHPEDQDGILELATVAASKNTIVENEVRVTRASGRSRHIRSLARIIRDAEGRPHRAVGTNWDVTEERVAAATLQRAKDAAEAAEQAKSEFLAMMSHEIRTPLNTVLGMTRLALQTKLTPKQHNYLNKIDLSGKALIAIVNDILDFSKIEAGKMELEEAEFTLEALLETVSTVSAIKAEEKGLEIAFDVSPGVPRRIIGDSLRLGQILINLVNNAVKFTDQGEVVVRIGYVEQLEPQTAVLQFSVRDTGIGLDEEQIAGLFQPFSQANPHVTRKYGGTGLGLAICRRLVEMMHGRIWVESKPKAGSTFSFTVKLKLPEAVTSMPRQLAGLSGRRVLVVDDNSSARDILSFMVGRFGMETTAVPSGHQALEALRSATDSNNPFELVLMDWRMPGMDGLEAARAIKTQAELGRPPAVLMVTAFAREEVVRRAEQLGLEGVLIKPVTESVMFNTIADVLGCALSTAKTPGGQKGGKPDDLRGRRVLITDDNAMNREVITGFLEAVGIVVSTARTGAEAVGMVKDHTFDAVLMDLHMQDMDGREATREIRAEPQLVSLPIIALTGDSSQSTRQACLAAGMNDHIVKPVDADVLYERLIHWVLNNPELTSLSGLRALVVDDNALNREVVSDFLLAAGMQIDTAIHGLDALSRLKTGEYDIVLMDIQMPQMGGLEATREIRRHTRWANLPIVALTAQAQVSDREQSLAAGMNEHLTKPIDEVLLYRTLRQLLPQRPRRFQNEIPPPHKPTATWPKTPPELNLTAALNHMGGQPQRVIKLLNSFVRDFLSTPAQVAAALKADNREAIVFSAHTIKSSAGYLGSDSLWRIAGEVESIGRNSTEHTPEWQKQVEAFIETTGQVLQAIQSFLTQVGEHTAAPPAPATIDFPAVLQLIDRIQPLLAKGDYAAHTLIEELCERLRGTTLQTITDRIARDFDDVEMISAGNSLRELSEIVVAEAAKKEKS